MDKKICDMCKRDIGVNAWYRFKIYVGHSDKLQCFKDVCEPCFVGLCGVLSGTKKVVDKE